MKSRLIQSALSVLALGLAATAFSCSGGGGGGAESVQLVGAGSSFAAPIFTEWFKQYHDKNANVVVEYQGIGSGGGIKQFTAGTVDFGASDAAMNDDEIKEVKGGVVMLPVTAGAEVIAYNLPNVSDLKISKEALAGIFLGKITKWNDPAIASVNPGVTLPDTTIHVVHRADGSGTTYVFTLHLSAISPEWKSGPGTGKTVTWPVGDGGKQNDGVTSLIQQTPGSIGYIEYSYALQSKLPTALLENKAGKYVKCTPESSAAALSHVEMPADLRAWAPDPEGDESYPIVSYTWLLCHPKYDDANKGKALVNVIDYMLSDGQKDTPVKLGYIPLPDAVAQKVKAAADAIKAGG